MKKKSPLHNVVYKVLQSECTILVIVIFALVAPIALWLFKLTYKGDCGNYDSNWLGFFGSYFGGILGGMATLLAVVFTIRLNKEEERQKDIRRSAFIIYLDFQFTFENIIEFVIQFWINNGNIMSCLLLNDTEFDPPFSNPIFNQFYFDPDWIKRVADLSVSSDFDSSEIKTIGEIYGHLMNDSGAKIWETKVSLKPQLKLFEFLFENLS